MGYIKILVRRYFIDATSAMALGLFSSLIIGLILSQLSRLPYLSFLTDYAEVAKMPIVVGAAIGGAIAFALKNNPLVVMTTIVVGALGYKLGGPAGAYIAALAASEMGRLVSGKTGIEIIITPFVTLVAGGFVAHLVGPSISAVMSALGQFLMQATEISPIAMGIVISVAMGMILTAPISSAALSVTIGLSGLAGGAATVGCCANMIGFAVISYRENRLAGLLSQGLGTSMLQVPNIVRRPQIWLPVILASAMLGPLSTSVFKMTNIPAGSGMGTSGLVGQFGTYQSMVLEAGADATRIFIYMALLHFILPAVLSLFFASTMRKAGWIKDGDMKLREINQ
ncbi:PTS transporter subunit IIC [Serratia microhaemolytica]|uniref:PTS transporter subunit IIC n=1 Tax=Serratia microhaemolytica TaxID=2675110 RepID=UPI00197E3E58|nr:PTS sugar transporter subunit IIC [Serratia microhaemolytica]